jgi:hypothetical protein
MTTIAIKNGFVAADGRRIWGDEVRGEDVIKVKFINGTGYGFTGTVALMEPMIAWHQAGAKVKEVPTVNESLTWTLIIMRPGLVAKCSSSCLYPEEFPAHEPIAFGSGCDHAMGAMLAGTTAKRAVEIVASLCTGTGGTIREWDIEVECAFSLSLLQPLPPRLSEAAE